MNNNPEKLKELPTFNKTMYTYNCEYFYMDSDGDHECELFNEPLEYKGYNRFFRCKSCLEKFGGTNGREIKRNNRKYYRY